MGSKDFISAHVSFDNQAIVSIADATRIPAQVVAKYGKGRNFTHVIGYKYAVQIGGKTYRGEAKGPRDLIRLYPAKS